jgi:chromosome segregation ATPase
MSIFRRLVDRVDDALGGHGYDYFQGGGSFNAALAYAQAQEAANLRTSQEALEAAVGELSSGLDDRFNTVTQNQAQLSQQISELGNSVTGLTQVQQQQQTQIEGLLQVASQNTQHIAALAQQQQQLSQTFGQFAQATGQRFDIIDQRLSGLEQRQAAQQQQLQQIIQMLGGNGNNNP